MKSLLVRTRLLPLPRRYTAITLFGFVLVRPGTQVNDVMMRHEMIHVRQQREWLYLPFFVLYVLEWLWRLFACGFNIDKAYRAISFEREAYSHQAEPDYLRGRKRFANYR